MPRYRLTIAYDGTDFCGWQKQHPPDETPLRAVQQVVEDTARTIIHEPLRVNGASRTDSGVHARGQVAGFDPVKTMDRDRVRRAMNARLPDDVLVTKVDIVDRDFNPIGDATSKGYRFSIAHSGLAGAPRPLFDRRYVYYSAYVLDVQRMHAAAQHLVGEHDFASFTRINHGRFTSVRTIHACDVTAQAPDRLAIDISGDGFLYNMVRIIAGTLRDVGRGKLEPDDMPGIIAACDRSFSGPTLPPQGLCLEWVEFGESIGKKPRSSRPRKATGGVPIRPERPEEFAAIYALNAAAFGQDDEAKLVDSLRDSDAEIISLVSIDEENGGISGHILFSPVTIPGVTGIKVLGLAPMAVTPAQQGKGIGTSLVKAGIGACRRAGADAVVVLGHPKFYPRIGFVPAVEFGIRSTYNVADEYFMAREITRGCLADVTGVVHYHPAFDGL